MTRPDPRNPQRGRGSEHAAWKRRGVIRVPVISMFAAVVLILPCFFWAEQYRKAVGTEASVPVLLSISFGWVVVVHLAALLFLGIRIRRRIGKEGRHHHNHPNVFQQAMEALDQIAGGDYNVFIPTEGNYHYSGLAEKINGLAKDLSSLERMRQEFVSNVSHEIQSPLTSISGFASLLKNEELSPERRLHYLEVIEAESKRLSGLSENLLRLSVLDSGQPLLSPGTFRLDKQIQDVLLLLEPQWSEKKIEPDADLEQVDYTGDEELLSQVWINILHNSIKFTPPGGRISVALYRKEDKIRCLLSDTGQGIPEEHLVRIFERFYKADKARDRSLGGNGLGLSIVRKIVGLHGGTVSAASKAGEGTVFTVELPVSKE